MTTEPMTEREKFEAEVCGPMLWDTAFDPNGGYYDDGVGMAYIAWQARAQSAVDVEATARKYASIMMRDFNTGGAFTKEKLEAYLRQFLAAQQLQKDNCHECESTDKWMPAECEDFRYCSYPSDAPQVSWQPIETVPKNETVILANFTNKCLLTGAPHVWTATYVTEWENVDGNVVLTTELRWAECSFAATNRNGEPTHWIPLPLSPNLALQEEK